MCETCVSTFDIDVGVVSMKDERETHLFKKKKTGLLVTSDRKTDYTRGPVVSTECLFTGQKVYPGPGE